MSRPDEAALEARSRATGFQRDRVTRRVVLAGSLLAALIVLIRAHHYAGDSRGGALLAAHQILAGQTPYPDTTSQAIMLHPHAFVTPPPLALIMLPLTVLLTRALCMTTPGLLPGGLAIALAPAIAIAVIAARPRAASAPVDRSLGRPSANTT